MILRLVCAFSLLSIAVGHASERASSVLAEINFARTQPQKYAGIVEAHADRRGGDDGATREAVAFLRRARPLPPLVRSEGISRAALGHAQEVGSRGGSGHSSANGATPWRRMARHGQWSGYVGENIDYGNGDPRSIVISLIVDRGVRSRAHRANLFSPNFRVVGVGVAPHANWGTMCVMNFATSFVEAGERRVVDRVGSGLRTEYMGKSFF